jgi:hypothetical protein
MCDNLMKFPWPVGRRLLAIAAMLYLSHAAANECLNLFPYDVTEDGQPKICQSAFSGTQASYGCQDYRSGENRYRVLYKGGRTPKAVLALNADGAEQILSSPLHGDPKLNCPLKAPKGIPAYASHRGIGVCRDDTNQQVACSIFQYAAARQTQTHLYMVFYPNDKQHTIQVAVEDAGVNENAMVAEIAYQLGKSLSHTTCCGDEAVQYFAYAYHLFPRSETYRHAYQISRAQLAMSNL